MSPVVVVASTPPTRPSQADLDAYAALTRVLATKGAPDYLRDGTAGFRAWVESSGGAT